MIGIVEVVLFRSTTTVGICSLHQHGLTTQIDFLPQLFNVALGAATAPVRLHVWSPSIVV